MTTITSRPVISVDVLNTLYSLVGSRRRVAEMIGVDGSTVTRALKAAGYSILPPGRPNEQLSQTSLTKAYWGDKESLREIASRTGKSHTTIRNRMIQYGIPLRGNS
jgi:transcriptional regulator of aromatic amino acid metabolism